MKQNLFKRIGFVLALVLTLGLYANAQTYVLSVPKGKFESKYNYVNTDNFFTVYKTSVGTNPSVNNKYFKLDETTFTPVVYDGVSYENVIKMESSTHIEFTSKAVSTVTIVQVWTDYKVNNGDQTCKFSIKFDGEALTEGDDTSVANAMIRTITDVAPGEHEITRGNGEAALCYVKVEYTEAAKTVLVTPTLSYADGQVTISDVDANADHIEYTINGGAAQTYTEPFDVNDGDVVKAWAVASENNEDYVDSDVAELTILMEGITVATPVIKQQNGTVGIYCTTPKSTIEYSLDNSTWETYSRPFTLSENTTVYARAFRENCNASEVASLEVNTVIPPVEDATFKLMANGSFVHGDDTYTAEGYTVAVGKKDDNVEGYKLILMRTDKAGIEGGGKVLVPELGNNATRTTIKTSGAPCTYKVVVPDGYAAARVTLYSYVNYKDPVLTYWSEVNGVEYADEVPLGAINGMANFEKEVPDARVFDLRNEKGEGVKEFTFTCAGLQTCFVVGMEIINEGPVYTQLPKPEITVDNAANVTITASAEAAAIKYTTDGTDPSADNGEVYTEPFNVADGTIVKAIALGSDENLTNDSDIAELRVFDNSIAVATPTFKQQNGTVGIYCDTESATIQYSVDNATWTTYARPFTLSENATIYARATKENRTDSEIAEFDVNSVIPSVEGATPHYIGFGSFPKDGSNLVTKVNANGFPEVFATDTDLQGFSLVLERTDGKIQTASNSVKFSNGETRTAFKTSGWKPYRINLPYNLRAVRVELASFINSGSAEPAAYWSEVNGVKYGPEIPMGAINNDLNPADIRVYDLRDSKGNGVNSFTFNYGGQQLGVAVMVEAVPFNLYFVGEQTGWSTNNPDYKFATTDGVTYTLTLPEGITGEWKICNGTWDWSFGKGASITINETSDAWFDAANFDLKTTGETTITFTLVDGSDVQDSSIASKILVEGEPLIEDDRDIYFVGAQSNWTPDNTDYKFESLGDGKYTLTLEEGITGEWKICDGTWGWAKGSNGSAIGAYQRYLLGNGDNLTLTTEGAATLEVEIEGDATYVTVKTSGYDAVFFDNTEAQWATPHAYVWNKAADTPYLGWPGVAMSQVPAPAVVTYAATNKDVYEVAVPNKGYDMIIFNNGLGGEGNQTGDLDLKLRHVYSYSPSTGETTSEPYDGTTGVDEIAVDDANVAPVYYNLQGTRVENPANGAYIMVRGSKVTKVIR